MATRTSQNISGTMTGGLRRELSFLAGLGAVALYLGEKKSGASWLGALALGLRLWPSSYSLRNRTVVITGGSRGLGLALAEKCLKSGCNVALLARESGELVQAQDILRARTSREAWVVSCDITLPGELERAFNEVEARWGRIDILINNAGAIVVGPFSAMDRDDFQTLLNLQVHAVVEAVQLLQSRWKQSGGRVVNICSIGGKIAVPHMSAYCAAKFAMAGLSQTLGAELARDNIVVTTVYPGLMRTGSPIRATMKGDYESEYAWFALGDVTPGLSISAEGAARRIVAAIRDGDREVLFPSTSKLAVFAQTRFPEIFAFTMRQAAVFFPSGQSPLTHSGEESKQWLESQPWYGLFRPMMDYSQRAFNQRPNSGSGNGH
jgi:short-subunit dehydrogenase